MKEQWLYEQFSTEDTLDKSIVEIAIRTLMRTTVARTFLPV
jgi:hypothetical protein